MPAFGTCAGLILLAREVLDGRADQEPLGVLDVHRASQRVRPSTRLVRGAAHDRRISGAGLSGGTFPGVFIRAPVVESVGAEVEVLAEHDGRPCLCRQGDVWASTFHPELSGDLRLHQWFVSEVMA